MFSGIFRRSRNSMSPKEYRKFLKFESEIAENRARMEEEFHQRELKRQRFFTELDRCSRARERCIEFMSKAIENGYITLEEYAYWINEENSACLPIGCSREFKNRIHILGVMTMVF